MFTLSLHGIARFQVLPRNVRPDMQRTALQYGRELGANHIEGQVNEPTDERSNRAVGYVLERVHKLYDEYFLRPQVAFRIVWQAIVNGDIRRLYREACSFLKLRAPRNRTARVARETTPRASIIEPF
jgi:hypothetical protein